MGSDEGATASASPGDGPLAGVEHRVVSLAPTWGQVCTCSCGRVHLPADPCPAIAQAVTAHDDGWARDRLIECPECRSVFEAEDHTVVCDHAVTAHAGEGGLRAAVEAVMALHDGMHCCASGNWWTNDETYQGGIAMVGDCPTRDILAAHAEVGPVGTTCEGIAHRQRNGAVCSLCGTRGRVAAPVDAGPVGTTVSEWGVVVDEIGSTDMAASETEARAWLAAGQGLSLVRVVVTEWAEVTDD